MTAVLQRLKLRKKSDLIFDFVLYLICILVFFIVAYPIYFIIIASVSDSTLLVSTGKVLLFPKGFSLFGYQEIFQDSRIWIGYRNTLIYAIGGTLD